MGMEPRYACRRYDPTTASRHARPAVANILGQTGSTRCSFNRIHGQARQVILRPGIRSGVSILR